MIGGVGDRDKLCSLPGAVGLLMPIDWPEPFGLVIIEAISCGTPVIAFDRGSVPEVFEDALTGFIVEDEAAAIAAVGSLDGLDRTTVRACFGRRHRTPMAGTTWRPIAASRRMTTRSSGGGCGLWAQPYDPDQTRIRSFRTLFRLLRHSRCKAIIRLG